MYSHHFKSALCKPLLVLLVSLVACGTARAQQSPFAGVFANDEIALMLQEEGNGL